MALKNLNFDVGINGIMPNVVTDAGIQGDHGVTCLNFALTEEFYNELIGAVTDGKVTYRFDIYDGEGGIWQSESQELFSRDIDITLQERHTRFGGKIVLYLVMTLISAQNKTEIELYNSPIVLRLKNRPSGEYKQGEDYESIVSIVEIAKQQAILAADFAESTKNHHIETQKFIEAFKEELGGINLDGVGIKSITIINDELVITYTDGSTQNLGNIKGPKGDDGVDGNDLVVDNTYSSTSTNAQSGKAVSQALALKQDVLVSGQNVKTINGNSILGNGDIIIAASAENEFDLSNYYTKDEIDEMPIMRNVDCTNGGFNFMTESNNTSMSLNNDGGISIHTASGHHISTNNSKIINLGEPKESTDAATKQYVDNAIDTAMAGNSGGTIDLSNYYTKYEVDNLTGIRRVSNRNGSTTVDSISGSTSIDLIDRGGIELYTYAGHHITVNNSKITNLGDPTNTTDAANKQYVDNALSAKLDSDAITDYATKQYVDDAIGGIVTDGTGGSVNLGNYYTKDEIDTALSAKLDGEIIELDIKAFSGNTIEDAPESCIRTLTSLSVSTMGQMEIVWARFDDISLSTNRTSQQALIDNGYIVGARYLLEFNDGQVTRISRVSVPYIDAIVGDIESLLGGI